MALKYLDYENGDDGNDGSDWANAWQTLTAADGNLNPGDTLRVAKTADPVSLGNCSWEKDSNEITLPSALTLNIDTCEAKWTAIAGGTIKTYLDTGNYTMEGSACARIQMYDSFTSGKMAHHTISGSGIDFSGYDTLSLLLSTDQYVPTGLIQIDLCSDEAGDTPVNTFVINKEISSQKWTPIVINYGGALGSSIKSITISLTSEYPYAGSELNIWLDNIIAANDFHHECLIGKNTAGETFWPIKSINGTTVELGVDAYQVSHPTPYTGDTESVTSYRLTPLDIVDLFSGSPVSSFPNGSDGSPITVEGGYNTTSSLVDGITALSGRDRSINFLSIEDVGHLSFKNFIITRFYGFFESYSCYGITFENCNVNNAVNAYYFSNTGDYGISFIDCFTIGAEYGIDFENGAKGLSLDNVKLDGCIYSGLYLDFCTNVRGVDVFIRHSVYTGFTFGSAFDVIIENLIMNNNTDGDFSPASYSDIFLKNPLCESSSLFYFSEDINFKDVMIQAKDWGQVSGQYRGMAKDGIIDSEATTRHSSSGLAWKLTPLSTTEKLIFLPQHFKSFVNADIEVTITAWVRKDSSYNGNSPRLVLAGQYLEGIDSDVIDSLSVGADEWEQLSVSGTPTEDGFIEFFIDCDGDAGSIFVDDINVAPA